jgi:hypothetical protein
LTQFNTKFTASGQGIYFSLHARVQSLVEFAPVLLLSKLMFQNSSFSDKGFMNEKILLI